MKQKPAILIVDDEPSVLNVVSRVMQATIACEMQTAFSGEAALKILAEKRFDVLVSDISMPGMDGTKLVDVVAELYPQTMRLIFSARSGGDVGLKAARSAHQFYLKPMDIALIAKRTQTILKLRDFLPSEGLDKVIARVRSLPSMPDVYLALDEELKKPDTSMDAVGRIIERDVGMSAKVLQLVNSAFFGMRERVNRPSQAAIMLGSGVLKSLVLGLHIFTEWTQRTVPCFSLKELWSHSLNVASAAQEIAVAEGCDKDLSDEIYVAGLFHDIGKLIIADNLPGSCEHMQTAIIENGLTVLQAEMEVLGATHADAGAYLMALWGFSDPIVHACAYHHKPSRYSVGGFTAVGAVHVANVLDYQRQFAHKPVNESLDADYIVRESLMEKIGQWRVMLDRQPSPHA